MIKSDQLNSSVADLGLLIGLLSKDDAGNFSVQPEWFSDPVSELEKSPTRVRALLSVLNSLFNATAGTQYTLINQNQVWGDISSAGANLPTGFCLVTPKADATSGVVGLGIFEQMFLGDLTISLYGSLPLFYLEEGQTPQFVPASNLTQYKNLDVAIDIYSSTPIQVGADSAFNLVSAAATASFDDSFHTNFALSFYQSFDPETGQKTQLPVPGGDDVLVGRLNVLTAQANYWLNEYIGDSFTTIGDILSIVGLVTKTQDPTLAQATYTFDQNTFAQLSKDPTVVLKKLLTTLVTDLFDAAITAGEPLVSLSGGGIYAVKDAETNAYGLRLTVPDFQLTARGLSEPTVSVQLGKGFTNETSDNNWTHTAPGIEILFLKFDGTTLSTTSRFELNSIGLDISGSGDAPLINLDGYTLKGAELRTHLDSEGWQYGFAMRLDDVSFPLGPNFSAAQSGGENTNVIAQNLLASADPAGGSNGGASPDTSAVNPGFSAEAGYISGHDPFLEIFDAEGNQTDLIWFPIQRRFGPINCQKVGVKIEATGDHEDDPILGAVFDGGVSLGGLSLYLDQLAVNAHLKQIADTSGYDLDLQGIDVDFSNGSVEINAGLLKTTDAQGVSYTGEALIKAANLTVAAVGSYSSLAGGGTSMFIFGVLNEPLGGPACFYVTGLMAGFGYNRSLKIPDQDQVPDFPLLAGLTNPKAIGGPNPKPSDALTKLAEQDWVPVQRGEYWLAAGVQFTTFKIINTNALVVVEFGNDLTIAVLGLSTLKQPIIGNAYVYAELGIEVVILPDQGEFKASAVLAPGSYVLTPDAHLTGGFAFYSWFGSSEHSGDFVLTLGGYHPAFNVPAHYPQEPPLGINWQISSHLSMIGTAYFALTPSAMMAGCGLQVTFHDGDLKAWLKMQADIIIFWKPFYVIADVSISVGVSYRISLGFTHVTVSAEIGADFHLWGPPIGGTVHIDWYIISFTIGFGADENIPTEIGWNDFKEMLPAKPANQGATPAAHAMFKSARTLRAAPPATNTPAYLNITSNQGLIRSHQAAADLTLWLVRASLFQFSTGSAIPASAVVVGDPASSTPMPGNKVGVQRVNGGISPDNYQSQQTITIVKVPAQQSKDDFSNIRDCMATTSPCSTLRSGCEFADVSGWEIDLVSKSMPQAMWGPPTANAGINADSATIVATVGVTMYPKPPTITNCTPEMVIDDLFEDRTVNADDQFMLPLSQAQPPVTNAPQDADSFADINSINDPSVFQRRCIVFATLAAIGVNAWNNDPLNAMAENPGTAFADEPMEGSTVLSSS